MTVHSDDESDELDSKTQEKAQEFKKEVGKPGSSSYEEADFYVEKYARVKLSESEIEDIKKEILDPERISLKYDPEGRKEELKRIDYNRNKIKVLNSEMVESLKSRNEKMSKLIGLKKLLVEKTGELENRKKTFSVKTKGLLGVNDKQFIKLSSEIDSFNEEITVVEAQINETEIYVENLKSEIGGTATPEDMLRIYYSKIGTLPLSNDEKGDVLREEFLSSLDINEYIALWRRLNPYFLSHVVRHGFRDHDMTTHHPIGLKEFHNDFLDIIESRGKAINPPKVVREEFFSRDKESVIKFLENSVFSILGADNEDEAKSRLFRELNYIWVSATNYPDRLAVDFASQIVPNEYYGAENENEIFFIYPSDFIASQHEYSFIESEADFTSRQDDNKLNNVFVWPESLENSGISLDAGIVFLPKSVQVDSETGSKYASKIDIVNGLERRVIAESDKFTENTISAKEFWEKYFSQNIKNRPKHAVFYDGNPTEAVFEFQKAFNIGQADVSGQFGPLLGFKDRLVLDLDNDLGSNDDYQHLLETANKIIEEYYEERNEI